VTRLTLYEHAAIVRGRYGRARKKEKGRILDEFCQTTGMQGGAATALRTRDHSGAGEGVGRGRPDVQQATGGSVAGSGGRPLSDMANRSCPRVCVKDCSR